MATEYQKKFNFNNVQEDNSSVVPVFADVVRLEANPETVALNFIQLIPGGLNQEPQSKVVSRVVLTFAHFARLAKSFPTLVEQNKEYAIESFNTSVLNSDEM